MSVRVERSRFEAREGVMCAQCVCHAEEVEEESVEEVVAAVGREFERDRRDTTFLVLRAAQARWGRRLCGVCASCLRGVARQEGRNRTACGKRVCVWNRGNERRGCESDVRGSGVRGVRGPRVACGCATSEVLRALQPVPRAEVA